MKKILELQNYEIVLAPLISEKNVGIIETQNKLVFAVHKMASKPQIKKAIEELYSVKIDNVKVLNDLKGRKRAIVKLNEKFKADDLATKLGII